MDGPRDSALLKREQNDDRVLAGKNERQTHLPSLHLYALLVSRNHIFFVFRALEGSFQFLGRRTDLLSAPDGVPWGQKRIPLGITSSTNMNSSHMLL